MLFWICKEIFFQTSIEYIFYPFIGIKAEVKGSSASHVQPIRPMLFYKIKDTHTGFEGLFRVFAAPEDHFDDLLDIIPYRFCPSSKTPRAPFSVIPVIRRHMSVKCCIVVWGMVPSMLGYSYIVVIDSHIPVIIDDPYTLSFKLPWHTVIMPVLPQFNMVIELYRKFSALFNPTTIVKAICPSY